MASKKKTEWVYDELLCFLGNPFFQIPVITFIEAHCLIFDPDEEDRKEYRDIHTKYKKIVQRLLDAFMHDAGLSHEEVIKALSDMNAKKDLREIFAGLFEQVLAMDDFVIFVRLMTQKNIELQQQALMLIIQTTGSLPESLQEGGAAPPPSKPSAEPGQAQNDEDEIMRKVLEKSKREFDEDQKRKKREEKKDKRELENMLLVSKVEVTELEKQKKVEKEKLEIAMSNLTTHEPSLDKVTEESGRKMKPIPAQLPRAAPAPQKPVLKHPEVPVLVTPDVSQTSLGPGLQSKPVMPGISSKEAAANWLKSAQDEASSGGKHSEAVHAAAAALSKLSAEELKKRQEYLKQQRDKLVEMKKKERERQLLEAEKDQPQRPMSARAARQSLQAGSSGDGEEKKISPEEQKKLEMRKAIANKLKAELMGGQ